MLNIKKVRMLRNAVVGASLVLSAQVFGQVTLSDIKIEGLNLVEPTTVLKAIDAKVGAAYDDDVGVQVIRQLYALGIFADVKLNLDQANALIIQVKENPYIAAIEFKGNRVVKTDALMAMIKQMGLVEGYAYSATLAEKVKREIEKSYTEQGRYGVEVKYVAQPSRNGQILLTYEINEGLPTKINSITVNGIKAISQRKARSLMDLSTGSLLTWFNKKNQYNEEKLAEAATKLTSYYKEHGYLNFEVVSSEAKPVDENKKVDIVVDVNEGIRYTVSEVNLHGDLLGKEDDFKKLIKLPAGKLYNQALLSQTVSGIENYYGKFGFALPEINASSRADDNNGLVAIDLVTTPNERVYVRRIDIQGNDNTKDEVIRREMRQLEGQWYNDEMIRKSRNLIDRTGFFSEVDIEKVPVAGAPDMVDLLVKVKERKTGEFKVVMGYSQLDKFSLGVGVTQNNFLGSGQTVGADVNYGKYNQQLTLSNVNPYFTQNGISRSTRLFYSRTRPYKGWGSDYSTKSIGGSIDFGLPISEDDMIFVGAGVEHYKIKTGTNTPLPVLQYVYDYGQNSTLLPITLGWSKNTTDSYLTPTKGGISRINLETSVLGKVKYVKAEIKHNHFIKLNDLFVLSLNGELSWARGLNKDKEYPYFKTYYGGGIGSVRAFEQGTLGPQDQRGNYTGGTKSVLFSSELLFRVPGLDKSVNTFVFYDMGNVYGVRQPYEMSTLRSSAGVGISWQSPMGLLRISWGTPIKKFPGDRIEKFQLQIGNVF